MEKEELLKKLNELIDKSEIYACGQFETEGDPSDWHIEADMYLLEFINDTEITEAFNKIEKWYD